MIANRQGEQTISSLTLRSLHPEDLEAVSEIESAIVGRPRRGFFEKRLAVARAAPESFITCAALDGNRLLGYGFARLQRGDFGTSDARAVLDVIGVASEARNRGIGKAVLRGIEERMEKKSVTGLSTQVLWSDSSMTGFWARSGFCLAPSHIIERATSALPLHFNEVSTPRMDSVWRVHSGAVGHLQTLSRERFVVRSLKKEDFSAVVRIDAKLTGGERGDYYRGKFDEMLVETGIRVSLVAEEDGAVVGFIMARVDFGEFGMAEPAAVIDTLGVHPAFKGCGLGHALLSQLITNLSGLKVERLRTKVRWEDFELQKFLYGRGFIPSSHLVLEKQLK